MQKIQRGEVTKYAFDNRDEPVLRVQAEEVFLAGEALHPHDPGTVHGAYWSGQRAARQVRGVAM